MRRLKGALARARCTTLILRDRLRAAPPPVWVLYVSAAISIVVGSYLVATAHPIAGGINVVYGLFLVYTIRRK